MPEQEQELHDPVTDPANDPESMSLMEIAEEAAPEEEQGRTLLLRCKAKLKKVDVSDASNGVNYRVQIEADAMVAEAFIEMMGEQTYEVYWADLPVGVGQIKTVNTNVDSENYPHTVVTFQMPSTELKKAGGLPIHVGQTRDLFIFDVQLAMDLTAKAE